MMRSLPRSSLFCLSAFLVLAFLPHCAKVGKFSGGDKDTIPPILITSKPEQRSVHFKDKKIELEFNEYLALKNIQQEFLISPPLKEQPITKLKGKTLEVELKDTLNENTTYTLNFGNSITDYTEGNPLSNFEFVFSTGSSIDSFSFRGKVFNASDTRPPKDPVLVMLYDNLADSAPLRQKPLYAGRTSKDGSFVLNNLRPGTFRVFVLGDANSNMRFDLPDEFIAFADSFLILSPELFPKEEPVTAIPDSGLASESSRDSSMTDSIKSPKEYAVTMNLSLFKEKPKIQYITDSKRLDDKKILFTFKLPLTDSFSVTPLDSLCHPDWSLVEAVPDRDTILYWITDTCLSKRESIKMQVCHMEKDTMGLPFLKKDTVDFRYVPPEVSKKKKTKVVKPVTVSLESNLLVSKTIDLNAPLVFTSPFPVKEVDTASIHVWQMVDTVQKPVHYEIVKDSLYPRRYYLFIPWKEDEKYKCEILPPAFTNIYNIPVDTLSVSFTTQKIDFYGKLIVTIKADTTPIILQLLDKDKIVRQISSSKTSRLEFDWLTPRKYLLKAIEDRNGNGIWDTGDYLKKIQPEKVLYYKEEFEVRSNWDLEIDIDMGMVK